MGGKGDVRVTIVERLKAARAKKFPDYEAALARVSRAEAAMASAEAELKAARAAVLNYGEGPRSLEWAIREVEDVLGDDA